MSLTIKVDDWGSICVVRDADTPENLLELKLTEKEDKAGPRGGHTAWSKEGRVDLLPGAYILKIEQKNATYNEDFADKSIYNISYCKFSIEATKVSGDCLLA